MPIMTSQHTNRTRNVLREPADISFAFGTNVDGRYQASLTTSFRDDKGKRQYVTITFTPEEFEAFVARADDYRGIQRERLAALSPVRTH